MKRKNGQRKLGRKLDLLSRNINPAVQPARKLAPSETKSARQPAPLLAPLASTSCWLYYQSLFLLLVSSGVRDNRETGNRGGKEDASGILGGLVENGQRGVRIVHAGRRALLSCDGPAGDAELEARADQYRFGDDK